MMSDPVIDEVREVRHRISARFDHDPSRLVAYYMELQKQFEGRLMGTEKPGTSGRQTRGRGREHGESGGGGGG
ncbi:MAG TPA: hypothetical protein VKM72_33025 [Thermoanaerobaculia bacterium]|nr:hypothetical protein [Thermoanaerobaculia bacterium]